MLATYRFNYIRTLLFPKMGLIFYFLNLEISSSEHNMNHIFMKEHRNNLSRRREGQQGYVVYSFALLSKRNETISFF